MSEDQPSLFDEVAHARRSDPVTSHDAAASIPSEKIRLSQEAVLGILRVEPVHDQLLVTRYYYELSQGEVPFQSESGIRTRRSELVAKGLVVDSGERVVLDSGRKSIVWAATTVTVSHKVPNG